MNTFFNAIGKKLSILLLVIIGGLLLSGCNGSEEEIPDNYYGTLLSEGKTVTISDLTYDEDASYSIDYSDDTRELIDVSSLTDDDVISIPSPTFETALRDYLEIEGDITYGDLRYVETLYLDYSGIESIAGIEYFENLGMLYLAGNPLTSINGIQTLTHLDNVAINHTKVRKIDYPTANVRAYSANFTLVDYTSETLIEMFENNQNLRMLHLENTPVQVTKPLYDYISNSLVDGHLINLYVDYKQVDYDTLGYRSFWHDDDGFWYFTFLSPKVVIGDDFSINDEIYDTLYINIINDEEWNTISQLMTMWIDDIGVEYADNDLEKILLVYDYFLEHIMIDDDGSEFIADALEGSPVTANAAYETLALLYRYIDIPSYAYVEDVVVYGQQPDEPIEDNNLLIVFYDNQQYVIHFKEGITYEYFMIGQDLQAHLVDDIFGTPDYLRLQEIAPYDLSRDAIETAAQALNIDLTYE